jgi:endo-1,4-beta-xylanase
LLPNGLFPTGDVWVGSTVGFPGSMTIRQLSLEEQPTGRWDAAAQTGPGLRSLTARDGITTATEFNSYLAADPRYCRTMQRDFDVAVISEFSDKNIWLGPGQYNFEPLDHEVDVAHRLGHNIYASHLVWGATESGVIPDWLLKGKFTREQYLNILEQHIKTIVGRYKDRVQEWSIANEAPNRDFYSGFDFWYDHIGPEYIEKSFQWAHEADPNAILIFNADNNESPRDQITAGNIDRMYNTVKNLKAKGVPIDVVGMQMHLLLPWNSKVLPKKEDVIATMQKFAALGVKVYITEMDVNLHGRPGTEEEKLQFEADLYQEMVSACVESGVCTRFSTWGISDSNSWETCQNDYCPIKNMDAAPLMFDANFHPKPAYEAVRAVLSGAKP